MKNELNQKQLANEIMADLLDADTPKGLMRDLREMMDAYFMYHNAPDPKQKNSVYATYLTLTDVLTKLDQIKETSSVK